MAWNGRTAVVSGRSLNFYPIIIDFILGDKQYNCIFAAP